MAEGGVATLPIIKHFEIFKDFLLGLVSCEVLSMMKEFPFHGAKEALDAGVSPAIAFAAHAGRDTVRGQQLLIGPCGLLTPSVGVMQESGLGLPGFERHAEGLFGDISGQARAHRPADDGTRVQVHRPGWAAPP